jgi:hypothetical protein
MGEEKMSLEINEMTHSEFIVIQSARRLLDKIDSMTSEEFSKGGEKKEREALRKALNRAGY